MESNGAYAEMKGAKGWDPRCPRSWAPLGEQLADHARPAGSERQPYGHLLLPSGSAGQQKICKVGTRDQQDHGYGERDSSRDHGQLPPFSRIHVGLSLT